MGKTIYLKLNTGYGVISIPFIGIEDVDDFTIGYKNLGELVTTLIKILKLQIDMYDVEDVYLTYDKYNRGRDDRCLPVRYANDNFNTDSLEDFFCDFLEKDHKRIWNSSIRYVKTDGMLGFISTGQITMFEIRNAVKAYFNGDGGYRKKRDVYFYFRKKYGLNLNIKIDKVLSDKNFRKKDLSVYDIEDDSYVSNIIDLYKRGIYTFDEAMEKIGLADLSELRKLLKDGGYGIIDGVSETDSLIKKDISKLEKTTGMSLETLRLNYTGFGRKKGFNR